MADAVEAARARRVTRSADKLVEIQSFVDDVERMISMTMQQRMRLATHWLKNRVVQNISTPVTRVVKSRSMDNPDTGKKSKVKYTAVTNRSKPGEFPKADTTQLMKTIFEDVKVQDGQIFGYVGTPLDYGLKLEVKMNRSFLVRSLREEMYVLRRILTYPITEGGAPIGTMGME